MKKFIIIFCVFIIPINVFSYSWPFLVGNGPNGPHNITATFGEFRPAHFHDGVDIGGHAAGTRVYSIIKSSRDDIQHRSVGNRGDDNEFIQIGKYRYVHVRVNSLLYESLSSTDPAQRILPSDIIPVDGAKPTYIAKIKSLENYPPHLHFVEKDNNGNPVNPLRPNGLNNAPASTPEVFANEIDFRRDGTSRYLTEQINGRVVVYGKVNIVTRARENFSPNGNENCGVYEMDYKIYNESRNRDYGRIQSFRFDSIPNVPINEIYSRDVGHMSQIEDSPSTFYYINTCHNDGNYRYWNTKQKEDNNPNIDCNLQTKAKYPDGDYRVYIRARNIKGTSHEMNRQVIIDNFAPYVKHIKVYNETDDSDVKYEAEWVYDPGLSKDYPLHYKIIKRNKYIRGPDRLVFEIEFSEDMKKDEKPEVYANSVAINKVNGVWIGTWIGEKKYKFSCDNPFKNMKKSDEYSIEIEAKDLAGNGLDTKPDTIAHRKEGGNGRIRRMEDIK